MLSGQFTLLEMAKYRVNILGIWSHWSQVFSSSSDLREVFGD